MIWIIFFSFLRCEYFGMRSSFGINVNKITWADRREHIYTHTKENHYDWWKGQNSRQKNKKEREIYNIIPHVCRQRTPPNTNARKLNIFCFSPKLLAPATPTISAPDGLASPCVCRWMRTDCRVAYYTPCVVRVFFSFSFLISSYQLFDSRTERALLTVRLHFLFGFRWHLGRDLRIIHAPSK
jgi:hypothetical protein